MLNIGSQHGFRSGRSCETQLVQFIHDLCENLDVAHNRNHKQTDLIIIYTRYFNPLNDVIKINWWRHQDINEMFSCLIKTQGLTNLGPKCPKRLGPKQKVRMWNVQVQKVLVWNVWVRSVQVQNVWGRNVLDQNVVAKRQGPKYQGLNIQKVRGRNVLV